MFEIFENLTKAAIGVVKLPIDLVADTLTLGGHLTDKDKPYTITELDNILTNLEKATK